MSGMFALKSIWPSGHISGLGLPWYVRLFTAAWINKINETAVSRGRNWIYASGEVPPRRLTSHERIVRLTRLGSVSWIDLSEQVARKYKREHA